MKLILNINNNKYELEADPRTFLLDALRDVFGLFGTKCGCGEGECGACTVVLNGRTVNSCLITLGQAHGGHITTIEGLAASKDGRIVLDTFADSGAVQCGFCTPGIAVSASTMVDRKAGLSEEEVRQGLSGHLCRCTGYVKIIDAVQVSSTKNLNFEQLRQKGTLPITISESPNYIRPDKLLAALEALADRETQWKVLAGGTDLSLTRNSRIETLNLLDISGIDELKGIREDKEKVYIGGSTTFSELIDSSVIREKFPSLADAARQIGGVQIQNAGTVGGNIANGSPAADIVPPLMAMDAVVELVSLKGITSVPLEIFYTGFYKNVLSPDQLIKQVIIPAPMQGDHVLSFFDKLGSRKALAISKVSLAMYGHFHNNCFTSVRIAMGSVAEHVITAPKTADILLAGELSKERLEQAAEMISMEAQPIDDMFSTEEYCRQAVRGLLIRNLWEYIDQ